MNMSKIVLIGVILIIATGCQNLGCAKGLEIVSYGTYKTDSPPDEYMMHTTSGNNNGDASGGFNWRDSSSSGRHPEFICREKP